MKYVCQGSFLTTSLDVLWLFSLSLSLTHTSVILAVWAVLAIHFLEVISIISVLFCSLSSPYDSYCPPVKEDKCYCWWHEHAHTQISTAVPRNVLESKVERRGNKMLLWRYTQACTDQKWYLNLQCFTKKFQIVRPYHTTCGFPICIRIDYLHYSEVHTKKKFVNGIVRHCETT